MNITNDFEQMNDFNDWVEQLENEKQPTCNVDNPEQCDSCGA